MKLYLSKILARFNLAFLLILVFTNLSLGATKDWTGTTSSDWNVGSNWGGTKPANGDIVRIGVVAFNNTHQPMLISANQTCSNITIGNVSGAVTLMINATFKLTAGTLTINTLTTVNIVNTGTLSVTSYTNNGTTTIGAGLLTVTGSYNNNSGSTTFSSGTLTVGGDFKNTAGATSLGAVTSTITGAFNNIAGTTTFGSGSATLNSNFTNTSGTTAFGTGATTVSGDFTNNGTVTTSTGTESFASMDFTNSGPLTFGTGLVTFNNAQNVTKFTANTSITFVNVTFSGGKNVQFPHSGNLLLAPTGVLTLTNTTQLSSAGGTFTLLSDATGSATIAAIPAGSTFDVAPVFVQRFIKGSADVGNLSKRGYRLITSTVFTGSAATGGSAAAGNSFDLQYLRNSGVFVSGTNGAANGFNVPTTNNPTVYLFREDEIPPPSIATIFTTGYNWKGVTNITGPGLTPSFATGTTSFGNRNNVFDQTVQLPVGNGVLFFFRGGGNNIFNYTQPFAFPTDATLTETGTLNTGEIKVRLWYNYKVGLGTGFTYTASNIVDQTPGSRPAAGFALVGNPYPSTINWEKYNRGGITASVSPIIYEFNAFSKQYDTYIAEPGNDLTSEISADPLVNNDHGNSTGSGTNFIASGQGFFVTATAANQTLTFTENAKINKLPTAASFLKFMGTPVAAAVGPTPFLRLRMLTDSLNNDDVVIRFNSNASANFILGEDAPDAGGSDALESLSVFSADSVKLAISTMPLPGPKPSIVHLFTGSPNPGTYQLNVLALKNMPDLYRVWLKDGFTGDSVDLKKTTSYSFVIDKGNQATFGANRFTVVFSQDPALAYKLISFTANRMANSPHTEIDWTTANEQSSTNFTVERSTDGGTTFNVAGGLQSTGAGIYSLVDKNTGPAQNFYRLKQEDINNTISYSDVVMVDFSGKNVVSVNAYPNPATNVINVDINAKSQGNVAYSIIINDSSGALISQATSAQSSWQTGVSNLLPGTYLVNVFDQHNKKLIGQAKFVKL